MMNKKRPQHESGNFMTQTTATSPVTRTDPYRLLFAEETTIATEGMLKFLKENGFNVQHANTGAELKSILSNWEPDFILTDLQLPQLNALDLLKELKAEARLSEDKIKVFVFSDQITPQNIRDCVRAGAVDILSRPLPNADLINRLILHVQNKRRLPKFLENNRADTAQHFLHLTEQVLKMPSNIFQDEDCLFKLAGMLAETLKAVRTSMIRCDFENRKGWVITANDNRTILGREIDLAKYPEILYVLRTGKVLALENLEDDPTMQFVARQNKEINFNSLIVAPVRMHNQTWGVVSARLPDSKKRVDDFEIRYTQILAHVMGVVTRNNAELLNYGIPFDPHPPAPLEENENSV
jgi:DNA-binding response OmpR family regulator